MIQAALGLLAPIFKSLLLKLLTETFLKDVTIQALEEAAKLTDNNVDDELVESVKKAWNK